MLKTLESTESTIQPGEGIVGVDSDNKAGRDESKLDRSGLDRIEIDDVEVDGDEVDSEI